MWSIDWTTVEVVDATPRGGVGEVVRVRIPDTCRYGPPVAARNTTKPWSVSGSNGGPQLTSRPQPSLAAGTGGSTEGVTGRSLVYVNVLLAGMSTMCAPLALVAQPVEGRDAVPVDAVRLGGVVEVGAASGERIGNGGHVVARRDEPCPRRRADGAVR